MDLRIMGNYLQPLGGNPAQTVGSKSTKMSFTQQLSENHRVIIGPGCTIPMWTDDTIYYGVESDNQDVLVTLAEGSTSDDPVVRIQGRSLSGEFDFTCHIKDIDPNNASYAEMCALIGWEERINPTQKKGLLMPTPLGMNVGDVTQNQNFVSLSSQYLASGMFGPSIATQTEKLLELYQKLVVSKISFADDMQSYASYRRVNDATLFDLAV